MTAEDKSKFDDFLKVIKYKSLESISDVNHFINFDDKAKAVSDFFDGIIDLGKRPFKKKNDSSIEKIYVVENKEEIEYEASRAAKPSLQRTDSSIDINGKLEDFVDMGNFPIVLLKLRDMALPERWELNGKPQNSVLKKYFYLTFRRAFETRQIVIDEFKKLIIFNTGLVNNFYDPIYVLLTRNSPGEKQEWKFNDFFVVGSGVGKLILQSFHPTDLPKAPQYYDDICDLLYDVHRGEPTPDSRHCIIDNIHRWPDGVHEHECPSEWVKIKRALKGGLDKDRSEIFKNLRKYVEGDTRVYLQYKGRFEHAVETAYKKVSWNYKTAVPMYWPVDKRIHLLLPLCLDSEEKVDVALVLNKTEKGYVGETILTLEMAYANARLVYKPESDWLNT